MKLYVSYVVVMWYCRGEQGWCIQGHSNFWKLRVCCQRSLIILTLCFKFDFKRFNLSVKHFATEDNQIWNVRLSLNTPSVQNKIVFLWNFRKLYLKSQKWPKSHNVFHNSIFCLYLFILFGLTNWTCQQQCLWNLGCQIGFERTNKDSF